MKRKTIKRSLLTKMILENIFFKSDFLMQDLYTRNYEFGEPPPKHYHFETDL
jgi:hypothetical protein